MPAGAHGGAQQPPPGSISVSQEEMDAINRLTQLGFPKSRAAEAFFACDKNEEMAANFLLESGYEDEDVATQQAIQASEAEMLNVVEPNAVAVPQPNAEADANANAAEDQPNADEAQPE